MKRVVINFAGLLIVAAGCSWLAQIWRFEGQQFLHQKERDGGIAKQGLISEGEQFFRERVASYESEGEQKAAQIGGHTKEQTELIEATGELNKEKRINPDRIVNASLADSFQGIRIAVAAISERLLKDSTSNSDKEAMRVVVRYLKRAEGFADSERRLGDTATLWSTCSSSEQQQRSARLRATRTQWLSPIGGQKAEEYDILAPPKKEERLINPLK